MSEANAFSDSLVKDFTWRVREISDVKKVAFDQRGGYEVALRKAAHALIYSHWEGYVKSSSDFYLKFIAKRKPQFKVLQAPFQAVASPVLSNFARGRRDTLQSRIQVIDELRELENANFRKPQKDALNTGGNLNFERFSHICLILCVDANAVIDDPEYLDEGIVGLRNRIAHGSSIDVDKGQLERSAEFVLGSMRRFRTELENGVVLKRYLRV